MPEMFNKYNPTSSSTHARISADFLNNEVTVEVMNGPLATIAVELKDFVSAVEKECEGTFISKAYIPEVTLDEGHLEVRGEATPIDWAVANVEQLKQVAMDNLALVLYLESEHGKKAFNRQQKVRRLADLIEQTHGTRSLYGAMKLLDSGKIEFKDEE